MRKRFAIAAMALTVGAWVPGCHSGKNAATTPGSGEQLNQGGGRGGQAEDLQTSSGANSNQVAAADNGDNGGGQPGNGGAANSATPHAAPRGPKIAPPGLDLPPQVRKARVEQHLRKAHAALQGRHKDPDLAIQEAKAALAVDETSVDAMLVLAYANYVKGYYDKAEAALDIAAKHNAGKSSAKLQFLYGLIYEKTDRKDQAMAAYQRAVERDPNYRHALLNLGVYYLHNKRYSEAIQLYERLTGRLRFDKAAAWNDLGSAYRGRAGELAGASGNVTQRNAYLQKAIAAYERALKLEANYADAYYNLGILYLDADSLPGRNGGKMDTLVRLQTAKKYLDMYRRMPGANVKLADKQASVVQDLYNREKKIRALRKRRAAERRKMQRGRK